MGRLLDAIKTFSYTKKYINGKANPEDCKKRLEKCSYEELAEMLLYHKESGISNALDLRNYDFSGFDFSGVNLSNCDFDGCDFHGADFRRAKLLNCNLKGCKLTGCNMTYCDLYGSDARNADFRHCNLEGADLRNCSLPGADLRGANLDYSCLPLWCGGHFKADRKICKQLIAHVVRIMEDSSECLDNYEDHELIKKMNEFKAGWHREDEF